MYNYIYPERSYIFMKETDSFRNWRCQDAECNSGRLFLKSDRSVDGEDINFRICNDASKYNFLPLFKHTV